ncbi:hypothetical protein DM793_18600 [Paenarthrobacter nitroguajacolicus]|uniref:hypothetical protein n=1 Tax=Paenarthrobacter nitroguajacolicus TaxID=211146 RepID=UPI0015B8DCED|nr:hypothetical protein [Paenarthrobacter nitroguajacolicus]NWL13278.1 hypothetical protein [Paenarthrobacter nitroguajacolicus]
MSHTEPAPASPTHTFRAVWPVIEGEGTATTVAQLIRQAIDDLPNVANRHGAKIIGTARGGVHDGRRVPGSGGARHVVVVEAPAVPTPTRSYHH